MSLIWQDLRVNEMIKKELLPITILALLILVLSLQTNISPWWKISTNKSHQILNSTIIVTEYYLSGEVRAAKSILGSQAAYLTIETPWNLSLKEIGVTEKSVANVTVPKLNKNILVLINVDFGAYAATFEGNANVTISENQQMATAQIYGSLQVEGSSIPVNFTCPISSANFPTNYLGTLLKAGGELYITLNPIATSIKNLNSKEEAKANLNSFLNLILYLTAAGSGLNALAFFLIILQQTPIALKKALWKYTKYVIAVATLLFLASFIYFIAEAPNFISKLDNVTLPEIYKLNGSSIKSLFGSVDGGIIYGPAYGCFLSFTTSLLCLTLYMLMRKVEKIE